jgi:DEAD/DEAH box helicase
MSEAQVRAVKLAEELVQSLAGETLSPETAKLYSQHTRLKEQRESLKNWRESEANRHIDEAIQLIEASLFLKEQNHTSAIRGLRRAAELLEWLSHEKMELEKIPTLLLSAALYQLAGYPARASGLLQQPDTEASSELTEVLSLTLKGDFETLFSGLLDYWAKFPRRPSNPNVMQSEPRTEIDAVKEEVFSSLGILCSYLRWGEKDRLKIALDKINSLEKFMLHSTDRYSWLLSKLVAQVIETYVEQSQRHHLNELFIQQNEVGKKAFLNYFKLSYKGKRAIAWPSQIRGFKELASRDSFTLCTPTGSGKTTVAEVATIQSLFGQHSNSLILYIVPKKALASEVEARLDRTLKRIGKSVTVTGLYGGTEWGPTDAWLTSEEPTVLICTPEKAEALIRFIGPLFLERVSLVILDEAHMVQLEGSRVTSETRSLRLETFIARLKARLDVQVSRIVALSAVAKGFEETLAHWIGGKDAKAVKSDYRSTRQLVGRLECRLKSIDRIQYDLLDGVNVRFENNSSDGSPYIPQPFPELPAIPRTFDKQADGPIKRLRPHLLWAAVHLARVDTDKPSAVLVAVPKSIESYAKDFLDLLTTHWHTEHLPPFFKKPNKNEVAMLIYERALASCADYFGQSSYEYELLQRGIVVHHGKMPSLLARYLVELINDRVVNLVLATSTLSEGVNLPFETILVPDLTRGQTDLSIQEFSNLIGRAGRPGLSTEGRTLVLVGPPVNYKFENARANFEEMIDQLSQAKVVDGDQPRSSLIQLLDNLFTAWKQIAISSSRQEFLVWLELTAPLTIEINPMNDEAIDLLDTLDGFILAALVESEELLGKQLVPNDLEEQMKKIWQSTYAYFSSENENYFQIFLRRSQALKETIYPHLDKRKQLYRTSLPPRAADQLIKTFSVLQPVLAEGKNYASWTNEKRFSYIEKIVEEIKLMPKFSFNDTVSRGRLNAVAWSEVMHWWLNPRECPRQPRTGQTSQWFSFINQSLTYKVNWGLGSMVALAIHETHDGELRTTSLEDWANTDLPWIVFWLKELLNWGTLDPVAAYLLAKGFVFTREAAQNKANEYYFQFEGGDGDDPLDATTIRKWANTLDKPKDTFSFAYMQPIEVSLERDFSNAKQIEYRVLPVITDTQLLWLDPAGYVLASCYLPEDWQKNYEKNYDFMLDVEKHEVTSQLYI